MLHTEKTGPVWMRLPSPLVPTELGVDNDAALATATKVGRAKFNFKSYMYAAIDHLTHY